VTIARDLDSLCFLIEMGTRSESPLFTINLQDVNGDTPLHHAVSYNHEDLVFFLLSNAADPNIPNLNGEYPIHLAVLYSLPSVKMLSSLENADLEVRNQNGATPLSLASLSGKSLAVRELVKMVSFLFPFFEQI